MEKGIIRDFFEVLILLGADYKQKFRKQFVCKSLATLALIALTAVFALLSAHYGVFQFGDTSTGDKMTIFGAIILIFLVSFGLAVVFTGGLIAIPFMKMWSYISENFGKKQHLVNVFLFALCTVFMVFTLNLSNIFEHLSGESWHGENGLYYNLPMLLFGLTVILGSFGLFGWLSGISEAWTHAVKVMTDLEKTENQRKQKAASRKKTATVIK
jgi:hypothetical protein